MPEMQKQAGQTASGNVYCEYKPKKLNFTFCNFVKGKTQESMLRVDIPHKECVGCGYCCIQHPCACGRAAHPDEIERGQICPSLHWNGGRYVCSLMMRPGGEGQFYQWQMNAGLGCRNFLNPWRNDVRERNGKDDKPSL